MHLLKVAGNAGGLIACGLVLALVQGKAFAAEPVTVYVSASGSDQSSGLSQGAGSNGPVATLPRALAVVRALKGGASPDKQFVILLSSGTYRLASPLTLEAADSGTAANPTIIQGSDPESVRITGTVRLTTPEAQLASDIAQRIPAQSRSHVVAFDLRKNGISSWTGLQTHGFNDYATDNANELFVNAVPQSLAAWPSEGYAPITQIPDGKNGLRFSIASSEAAHWGNNPKEIWADGFWSYDWADGTIPLAGKSEDGQTFNLMSPSKFGLRAGGRVRFLNVPEELKEHGQWYFDDRRGIVYVWLDNPQQAQSAEIELSVAPLLVQMSAVSHLRLKNLTLEGSRGNLINADNIQDVIIDHCTLRNSGRDLVLIQGGDSSGVTNSAIQNAGGRGIVLFGGNRTTLQSANLFATHNTITNFGRIYHAYQPGVQINGVGNHVEHNRIYNGPHQGIIFGGNDQTITFNEVYDVDLATGDAGAIYGGRDWTARGTQVKYNYLHNIQGTGPAGATGVYVDDQGSGTSIQGNIFYDVHRGVLIGGGLDNTISNNLFVDCVSAVHLDARGLDWQKKDTQDPNAFLQTGLKAVPYQSAVYRARYPQLANVIADGLGTPRRNIIEGNIFVRSGGLDLALPVPVLALQQIGVNQSDNAPISANARSANHEQAPPATSFQTQAARLGAIPLGEIGP